METKWPVDKTTINWSVKEKIEWATETSCWSVSVYTISVIQVVWGKSGFYLRDKYTKLYPQLIKVYPQFKYLKRQHTILHVTS